MYDKDQIADVIREVLTDLSINTIIPVSEDAVHILMMLGAHESHFGTYLKQKGGGPALGFYQIEPPTEKDVLRYLREGSKTQWKRDLYNYLMGFPNEALKMNLWYQTVIARVKLWMITEPLPSKDDLPAMAMYCKQHWNTDAGKAKPEDYLVAYKRYVRG